MEQVFTLHMVGWWSIVQNFENVTLSVVMLNIFYLDLCRTLQKGIDFACVHIITARKRSLGQGHVFTRVCQSVHTGRKSPSRQRPP